MYRLAAEPGDRLKSALAVAAIHALIGYALLRGLGVPIEPALSDAQQLIAVTLDPPPPQIPAPPDTEPERASRGPRTPKARRRPPIARIRRPKSSRRRPKSVLPPPPSIPSRRSPGRAARRRRARRCCRGPEPARAGSEAGSAAAASAMAPAGAAAGAGSARATSAAESTRTDYPRRAVERRAQGTTYLRFTILPNGRVRDCVVTRSSGHRDLDAATCPLLERRLRYRPARDATGRPVAETIRGEQAWQLGPEPPVREYDGEVVEEVREIRRRRF